METMPLKAIILPGGRTINPLGNASHAPGKYTVSWNGNDRSGQMVPDGVSICRMRAGDFTGLKTMKLYRQAFGQHCSTLYLC